MSYKPLDQNHYYIDKTAKLDTALKSFPCIYLEGAAASGKTTAVKMLLNKIQKKEEADSDLTTYVFNMQEEKKNEKAFFEKLQSCKESITKAGRWVIFENLHSVVEKHILCEIAEYIQTMEDNCHCICISREEPAVEFLQLIWNRDMDQITMSDLILSRDEVARMLEHSESQLQLDELYHVTGGWAGCVDLMIRYSVKNRKSVWEESNSVMTVSDLRKCHEIDTYIREYIMGSLSSEEDMLMQRSQVCPWLNKELCHEVWGLQKAELLLDKLTRKGYLTYNSRKSCWKTAPLFRKQGRAEKGFWKQLGAWYERNHYMKEALDCFAKLGVAEAYKACVLRHYTKIPYNNIDYHAVMSWKDHAPAVVYLRAMYCYENRDFEGFDKELSRISAMLSESYADFKISEIFLNLQYVNINLSLDEWLELLKKNYEKENQKTSLYQIQGNSTSALCGLRDLTELFSGTKKEENRKLRIWKECLSQTVWHYYEMARMEYYLETERRDSITPQEEDILRSSADIQALNLLIKIHIHDQKEESDLQIEEMANSLSYDDKSTIAQAARSLQSLYFLWHKQSENMIRLVRHTEGMKMEITEENYAVFSYLTKGYMQLHQYDKAKKILSILIPYLKMYRRGYPLAEHLYQMAIIRWKEDHHGQALQYMIESFLISRQTRYVNFYASYGKNGIEVLEAYLQWMQANAPDGWHRKKKYQYGNVLRMPEADYMGVIMRCIKRQSRVGYVYKNELRSEHLTMMETIILQDINRGLTNTEICEDLNLKLPTVKTHIYSLYKKLGVNTRVQAIIKGKERGFIE